MHGAHRPVARWVTLLVPGLAGALLLACAIPGLSRSEPTPTPTATPTPQPLPSPTPALVPTPAPGTSAVVTRISEEEMRAWLQGAQAHLGEGIEFQDTGLTIHSTGIAVSGNVRVAQLGGVEMPVDIVLRPLVVDQHLRLEVLDVRLGGGYSSLSSLVKPLVSSGISQSVDVERLLAEQGVRVSDVELQDGFMVVTSVPATP